MFKRKPDSEHLRNDIARHIPTRWVTAKEIAEKVGVSWHRIRILLLQMSVSGEIDGCSESFVSDRSRVRHHMLYRRRKTKASALEKLFGLDIPPRFPHISVTKHKLER